MKIESKFSNGDKVFTIDRTIDALVWVAIGPYTIGQVNVMVRDSPGVENTFGDNFKAQKSTQEKYMFVEKGVGSGRVYDVSRVFGSKEEAEAEAKRQNNQHRGGE